MDNPNLDYSNTKCFVSIDRWIDDAQSMNNYACYFSQKEISNTLRFKYSHLTMKLH
jgi:hypothetical protein